MRHAIALVLSFALAGALVPACGNGRSVPEASCQACANASYTEADCRTWGAAAGCESSSFVASPGGGCTNGCSFKSCNEAPRCGVVLGTPDAGAAVDADAARD